MSDKRLTHFHLLPELELIKLQKSGVNRMNFVVRKTSAFEVCPRCATKATAIHDRRRVLVADAPLRGREVTLEIIKRRFRCPGCQGVFMEPVRAISKGKRFTQRFKNHVLWCCERFTDLKAVKKHVGCSYGFLYSALYEQLELNRRKHISTWTKIIGIDEHSFRKNKEFGYMEFATMFVDHRNRRTFEMAHGKSKHELKRQTSYLENPSNVSWVTMDLSSTFKSFAKESFPTLVSLPTNFTWFVCSTITSTVTESRSPGT